MAILRMSELELAGKRVLIREDFNVPIKDGVVIDDTRIRASLSTIHRAAHAGARVMLMSHLGRPQEGAYDERLSLGPVAHQLAQLLPRQVPFLRDWIDAAPRMSDGDVVIFENVRFNKGEMGDDDDLAKKLAELCDVYVMDAFGSAAGGRRRRREGVQQGDRIGQTIAKSRPSDCRRRYCQYIHSRCRL